MPDEFQDIYLHNVVENTSLCQNTNTRKRRYRKRTRNRKKYTSVDKLLEKLINVKQR